MAVIITIISTVLALLLFILAEHKEELWDNIKFKDDEVSNEDRND